MKYKVGDYVTREDCILLRVDAAIDIEEPLYGLNNHKTNHIDWHTEYELDKLDFTKGEPDLQKWLGIKQGDMVHCGAPQSRSYKKVIARIDNLVMLSASPVKPKDQEKISEVAEQLDALSDDMTNMKEEVERFRPLMTTSGAQRVAQGEWISIEKMSLMNWELLQE